MRGRSWLAGTDSPGASSVAGGSLRYERLEELIEAGELRATDEIRVELGKKDDEVLSWALERRDSLFVPIDDAVQRGVRQILQDHPKLVDTRSGRSSADPFVIALAQVEGCPVITGELPTNSQARPKIPDVCTALGIPWMGLLDLLRQGGWSF